MLQTTNDDRRRFWRLTGLGMAVVGILAFGGFRTLFLDHWIAITMFGLLGWISAAVYVALATIAAGVVLMALSYLPARTAAA